MDIFERSTASPRSGQKESSPVSTGSAAQREKLSLPAVAAARFAKFDIGQRARFLGRLLASVGPLALKVVSGGVFAKYVRHARSAEIPVSFEDAARATSSQVQDLVNYVEQSNPSFVEGLSGMSTTLSRADAPTGAPASQTSERDARTTSPSAPDVERENSPPALRLRRRDLHDY
jgi:hypothetical protein